MRIIELEQAIADKVVNRVENVGLGLRALVAGGAPRSWYLGESCNDIDVYVQVGGQDDVREAIPVIEHALKTDLTHLGDYEPVDGVLLRCLTTRVDGKEVQIMFVNVLPEEYVDKHFDYSISKFIYRNSEIEVSWEAEMSLRHNVVVTPKPRIWNKYHEKLVHKFDCMFVKNWDEFLALIDKGPLVADLGGPVRLAGGEPAGIARIGHPQGFDLDGAMLFDGLD